MLIFQTRSTHTGDTICASWGRPVRVRGENRLKQSAQIASLGEMPEKTIDNTASAGLPLGDGFELEKHLESIQKAYLHRAMDEAKGTLVDAAKLLGISKYQTLSAQLKRLDVHGDWNK